MKTTINDDDSVAPLLLTEKQVVQLLQISARSVERMKSAKQIPGMVRLLKNAVRYRRDVIEAWIAAGCPRIESSDNGRRR